MYLEIAVGCGLTVTAVSRGSVPKFGVYGVPVTHASLLLDEAPEDAIIIGPTTRSLLPGMFKVKEFKEVAGVGLAHQLLVSDLTGYTGNADRPLPSGQGGPEAVVCEGHQDSRASVPGRC